MDRAVVAQFLGRYMVTSSIIVLHCSGPAVEHRNRDRKAACSAGLLQDLDQVDNTLRHLPNLVSDIQLHSK